MKIKIIATVISFVFLFSSACASKQKTEDNNQQTTDDTADNTKTNSSADVISLSALFSNREKYNGKTIRVKGTVKKVNENIMNKNWIHIDDGTLTDPAQDLTVTTSANATNGEEVVFEGMIVLNKDYGSGYMYDIIMEDAKLVK